MSGERRESSEVALTPSNVTQGTYDNWNRKSARVPDRVLESRHESVHVRQNHEGLSHRVIQSRGVRVRKIQTSVRFHLGQPLRPILCPARRRLTDLGSA